MTNTKNKSVFERLQYDRKQTLQNGAIVFCTFGFKDLQKFHVYAINISFKYSLKS